MTRKPGDSSMWCLVLAALVALSTIAALLVANRPYSLAGWFIRGTAMLGYLALFAGIVSSALVKWISRRFGRPFIQVHHLFSITGLLLLTLHPLGVVLQSKSLGVLVPSFASLDSFLSLGGRPAWYLLAATALTALLRRTLKRSWRVIHTLNYAAFFLATAHAWMIGTDFGGGVVRVLTIGMTVVVVAVLLIKRLGLQRR